MCFTANFYTQMSRDMLKAMDGVIASCKSIITAYEAGLLGGYGPAESTAPDFPSKELRYIYYTLPMALNYRRPSHQLWQAAKDTFLDSATRPVFDVSAVTRMGEDDLRPLLTRHSLALQPQRHTLNWSTIATAIQAFGSVEALLKTAHYDFLEFKQLIQKTHKRSFPYLSGPKLFNFWCFILASYCEVAFTNKEHIDIAVDSHIRRSSALLGVITSEEMPILSAEHIATRWRKALKGSDIAPTDLNVPLWYWSRDKYRFRDGVQLQIVP